MEAKLNKHDELVMKLLHYFITEYNYNPIVLHGAKDEIWLENLEQPYKVVRIVTNYIHNNEQFDFDLLKTNQIVKRIKKKTLLIQAKVLSIFVNLGDSVNLEEFDDDIINFAKVNSVKDLKKYNFITEYFPTIENINNHKEKGTNLFVKLTSDINAKNENDAEIAEDVFKMKKPVITPILIAINLIIFLAMYLFGNGSDNAETLVKFGAMVPDLVNKNNEYFRLITSGFLHVGIFHLFFNMYALYVIGPQIESFFGKYKFIAIYLVSLIVGNLMSLIFLSNFISAGASGAIFGLLGSLLYFGYHYRIYLGSVIKSQVMPLIIINLLIGFSLPGINNFAHIGGLIGGILISMAVGVKYKSSKEDIINGYVLLTIFTLFLLFLNNIK
jgi:rhomboid protease GluP